MSGSLESDVSSRTQSLDTSAVHGIPQFNLPQCQGQSLNYDNIDITERRLYRYIGGSTNSQSTPAQRPLVAVVSGNSAADAYDLTNSNVDIDALSSYAPWRNGPTTKSAIRTFDLSANGNMVNAYLESSTSVPVWAVLVRANSMNYGDRRASQEED